MPINLTKASPLTLDKDAKELLTTVILELFLRNLVLDAHI